MNFHLTPLHDFETLNTHLLQGHAIVTPNNRLSNQLLEGCLRKSNKVVQVKPLCLPYQAFLQHLFMLVRHQYADITHPFVLTPVQETHIWREIISKQQSFPVQLGLIQKVQTSWSHCQNWLLDINADSFHYSQQTAQFQQWHQALRAKLKVLHAITEVDLACYIQQFPDALPKLPTIWACFDEFTPLQQQLIKTLEQQGNTQYQYDLNAHATNVCQYAAADKQDEFNQLIYWLQEQLSQQKKRIAVVVPDLQQQAQHIQRLFKCYFTDEQFNLSLGETLIAIPMVRHAITWLSLDLETIHFETVQLLLHSPFIAASHSEMLARAQLMHTCKLLREEKIHFNDFLQATATTTPDLHQVLSILEPFPDQETPGNWVALFKNRLKQIGFPGEYALNSAMYQCFQRLQEILDTLLQLQPIHNRLSHDNAIKTLIECAQMTVFQTQKPTAPIQVLGLLEASGCTFDSLWVLGMTNQCLPQKTNLSAFIPIPLQRELSMPHALPEREWQFARQQIMRLIHGCHDAIFSYPKLQDDMPHLPSPLIADLPPFPHYSITDYEQPTVLQEYTETYMLPSTPNESIRGGTLLLANQAKCPFRAFAAHRLHLKAPETYSHGPDMRERGQVLHQMMEHIWQAIGSQERLLQLPESDLQALIETSIQNALASIMLYRRFSFPSLLQAIERQRLRKLIQASLIWEKSRPPFQIAALEASFAITLGKLDLKVRVDRIDSVGEDKWVIDYKSHLPTNNPWNEDRPEEPQLLLYALLDSDIHALLFLELKQGSIACKGISELPTTLQGIKALKKDEKWSNYRKIWQKQLESLAEEFLNGHCAPTPRRLSVCQTCDFASLCRYHHRS